MSPNLEHELIQIDPIFFEDAIACSKGEMNQMDTCMYWGIDCDDGWYKPLKLFLEQMRVLNQLAKESNFKCVCDQLKEKYGKCCIYYGFRRVDETKPVGELYDVLVEIIDRTIYLAEDSCDAFCEVCGSKDNLVYTEGWIKRVCDKCKENI